jgi:outer membrane immunogenic protein
MKNIVSAAAMIAALSAGSAFAADLPSHKAPPAPPALSWTGAYAGLNAGYNWGTNGNVTSQNYAPAWTERAPEQGEEWSNAAGPLALSGNQTHTQSGFVGGAQFGYNYQWGTKYVFGIETDIQGAGVNGSSTITNSAVWSARYTEHGSNGFTSSAAAGSTVVDAGINYLGTVRGRVGYLVMPTLLIYGTGGFTYGGAYAKVAQSAVDTTGYPLPANVQGGATVYSNATWVGGGRQNQILTGWNAGGGVEWMVSPNWSVKFEGSYWDLGRMNVATATTAASGQTGIGGYNSNVGTGRTSVSYSGVIAKAGVNYHFNWVAPAAVMASF